MPKLQNIFKVAANEKLCPNFHLLRIEAKSIQSKIKPGQFVHIRTAGDRLEPFFRRPFSVYRSKGSVDVFYEAVGPGTTLMTQMKKGDAIDVVGPVGTPFAMPGKNIEHVVMIAGGIGIAPFMMLSDILKKKKLKMTLMYGGRTRGHVYPMKEFKENGCKVHVATDDGSVGTKGRVSKLFSKITTDADKTMIYTCGPNPMMASVQAFARKKKIQGQAACEEIMACALGACLGCSIKTTNGFRTVCYDGPVFDLQEVIFDH